MLKQILIGLVCAGLGGLLIFYSTALADAFGRIPWFEAHLGGTRNGYVIVGFGIVVIGFLIVFGVIPTSSPTQNLSTFGTGS